MQQETVTTTPDTTKVDSAVNNVQSEEVAIQDKIFDGNAAALTKETKPVQAEVKTEEPKKEDAVKTEAKPGETKYELKLMEGSALDPSAVERISQYAKEKGLTQEAAQEILSREDEAVTSYRDNQLTQHMEVRKTWVEAIKNDKEYGGDKFNQNAEIAKRVINEFADTELKQALDATGYGDNPALFKFVVKLGQKLQVLNDSYVKASAPSQPKKELHEIMYPNHKE
jgi:hypothetical protein